MSGCSSVGRASAFQAEGREFESRRPLHFDSRLNVDSRPRSSGVERLLGKEEVMSSNLIAGSRKDFDILLTEEFRGSKDEQREI